MVEREKMTPGVQKMRDFYEMKKGAPVYREEFGFFTLDRWHAEGSLSENEGLNKLFGYDESGKFFLGRLGWCESEFSPIFKEEVLEDRGEYELVRDYAGRHVLYFKGRRNGFWPKAKTRLTGNSKGLCLLCARRAVIYRPATTACRKRFRLRITCTTEKEWRNTADDFPGRFLPPVWVIIRYILKTM